MVVSTVIEATTADEAATLAEELDFGIWDILDAETEVEDVVEEKDARSRSEGASS